MNSSALILLYTGDGKGKTSATMGTLFRALGHHGRCAVAQFIKSEEVNTGEKDFAESLQITWRNFGVGFTWEKGNDEANRAVCFQGWETVKTWIESATYDLIVLDEFTYPLNLGYVQIDEVITYLAMRRSQKNFPHLVITGRKAPQQLVDLADMVSEIIQIKHHWHEQKISSQEMIEY